MNKNLRGSTLWAAWLMFSALTTIVPVTAYASVVTGTIDHIDIFVNQASIFMTGGATVCTGVANGTVARLRMTGVTGGGGNLTESQFGRFLQTVQGAKLAGRTLLITTNANTAAGGDGGCIIAAITLQ